MSDTSGNPLVPLREARLSPDDVAERSFSEVKRGYAANEVRAFLRLVADELSSAANRARELAMRVESLEDRLAMPKPPPSDQDLIAALGEETARVLGQARESAIELRTKAEEHARNLVREAQENARQLRATTQQAAETKAREAEDAARGRANEIVTEARTMRDRVLGDLAERRQELERQVSELRAGRGRLVETYQIVERALAQATRLMGDEPGAASPALTRAAPVASPADTAPRADPAAGSGATDERSGDDGEEGDQPGIGDATPRPGPFAPRSAPVPDPASDVAPAADVAPAPGVVSEGADVPGALEVPDVPDVPDVPGALEVSDVPERAGDEPRDVGALFDRLRSEQGSSQAEAAPVATPAGERPAEERPAAEAPAPEATDEPAAPDADQRARQTRDDALAPVADDLGRRAKRAVQDEQNDVLDGLRRQRGKIDTTKVLPASDEQLARWAHVLQPAVDRAYEAGAVSTGAPVRKRGASVPAALLTELTSMAVTPLRSRLEESLASVDARTPADLEITIAQALGAKYREWRTQDLDGVLDDALAVAYARGVYAAAPQGAQLRWVPEREGKCPDCDDNALELTTKGDAFPTGQTAPPAHPGCRCLLVVESGS